VPRVLISEPSAAEEVRAFLDANDYPHDCWSVENLRLALLVRVGTAAETVAWVWFNWVRDNDKVLEMHACAARERRGSWITPFVTERLTVLVEMLGTTLVIAQPQRGVRFMRKLGFEVVGRTAFRFINQEETPDGTTLRGRPQSDPVAGSG
jgi:hypothetical protein